MLSLSENNGTHKRALIDRKAMPRVYLDYCSEVENTIGLSCTIIVNVMSTGCLISVVILAEHFLPVVIPTERSDEGSLSLIHRSQRPIPNELPIAPVAHYP